MENISLLLTSEHSNLNLFEKLFEKATEDEKKEIYHQVKTHFNEPVLTDQERKPIPYSEIVALFHELNPDLQTVQVISKSRQAAIRARWNESRDYKTIAFWRYYFSLVRNSNYLQGRVVDWRATFDWLLKPRNFVKVLEGNYS